MRSCADPARTRSEAERAEGQPRLHAAWKEERDRRKAREEDAYHRRHLSINPNWEGREAYAQEHFGMSAAEVEASDPGGGA